MMSDKRRVNLEQIHQARRDRSAAVVPDVTAWVAEGLYADQIAERLNEQKRPTSFGAGGLWTAATVGALIRRYDIRRKVASSKTIPHEPMPGTPEWRIRQARGNLKALELRRKAAYAAIAPRARELWKQGLTHQEIIDRFNAETDSGTFLVEGGPLTLHIMGKILRDNIPADEYRAMRGASRSRGRKDRAAEAWQVKLKALPRALQGLRDGLAQRVVAEQLNANGFATGEGKGEWTPGILRDAMRRYLPKAEFDSIFTGNKRRVLDAQKRRDRGHFAEVWPSIARHLESGMTLGDLPAALNAEGISSSNGSDWSERTFFAFLREHLPEADYEALADRGRRRVAETRRRHTNSYYKPIVARIWELWQDDRTDDEIAERLNHEKHWNSKGGPITAALVGQLRRQYPHVACKGESVIFGAVGDPVLVLALDGGNREVSLGSGGRAAGRWKLLKAIRDSGTQGAKIAALEVVCRGARGMLDRLIEDNPALAAVLYRPDKAKGLGWRFGPPRTINGEA